MEAKAHLVKMVVDANSLECMQHVANLMGIKIEILATSGNRYSYRGGEGEGTSIVPMGCNYIAINAGDKLKTFWDKVSVEKTKRRLIWEAANPITN